MTYSTSGSVVWGRQIQENTVSMTTLHWRIQTGFLRDTTKPENENTGETCSSRLVCCYLTTMGNGVGCRKRTTHILQVILASFCHLFVKIDHTLNDRYYSFFLLVSVIYRTKETVLKDQLFNKCRLDKCCDLSNSTDSCAARKKVEYEKERQMEIMQLKWKGLFSSYMAINYHRNRLLWCLLVSLRQ